MKPAKRPSRAAAKRKLQEAMQILSLLGFGPRQRNEVARYSLLALVNVGPDTPWAMAEAPLYGVTPIMRFIAKSYRRKFAQNTRENFRDDAVTYFVESGLAIRNPDCPSRATTSPRTVYQIEPSALELVRSFGGSEWERQLTQYLAGREGIRNRVLKARNLARVPVSLPDGSRRTLSPSGQNPLIKAVIEEFCPRFVPGGAILYIGDTENKFVHLEEKGLAELGVGLDPSSKVPDVIAYHQKLNWLLLIEAVTSAGPVDSKRRKELKALFKGCSAGLVFVTAFDTRQTMRAFLPQIAWESEVWIAEDPNHMIHFDGERFLGPYEDTVPGGTDR